MWMWKQVLCFTHGIKLLNVTFLRTASLFGKAYMPTKLYTNR